MIGKAFQTLVLSTVAFGSGGFATPSSAQSSPDVQALVARYQACPPGGVQRFISEPRRAPSPADRPDLIVLEPFEIVEIWPDSPSWTPPPPVPEVVLADPASWMPPVSAMAEHQAVRDRLNRPLPAGSLQVLVFERSHHWTKIQTSIAATRDAAGVWQVDRVHEYNVDTERAASEFDVRLLSSQDGARLDALLTDPCLRAEPVNTDYSPMWTSNETRWTLEVVGSDSPLVVAGGHSGFGRTGGVVRLVANSL